MCGRYTLHHHKNVLEEHFKIDFGSLHPRYNLAPTERIKFVFSNADERRQAGVACWGLVPHWSKTGTTEMPLFNARSETVLQKPAFRNAFIRGRCLIPASGWYEWRRDEKGKQPYHLRLETGEPFAFAGLFDVWRGESGERLVSCVVLTTVAPEELRWLHERMPVIIDYDHYDRWLNRGTPDVADLTELLVPYLAEGSRSTPSTPRSTGPGWTSQNCSRRWAVLRPSAETRCVDGSPLEDRGVWLSAQLLIVVLFTYAKRT